MVRCTHCGAATAPPLCAVCLRPTDPTEAEAHKNREEALLWTVVGFLMQVAGVAFIAYLVYRGIHRTEGAGVFADFSIGFVWHEALVAPGAPVAVATAVIVYLIGSVCVAAPWVHRRALLFVAVPAAALATLVLLGVVALVVWAVIALSDSDSRIQIPDGFFDIFDRESDRKKRRPPDPW